MIKYEKFYKINFSKYFLTLSLGILIIISVLILNSISPSIFPGYYIYIFLAIIIFLIFIKIDFDVFSAFSKHLYWLSIFFLVITFFLGKVTRGSIRWIPIGFVTIQPSEVFRAFILLYLAKYITEKELTLKRTLILFFYFLIPFILILIQPSLGVAIVTMIGFLGLIVASPIEKKYFLYVFIIFCAVLPLFWFILAPYQKERIRVFLNPYSDPQGAGYNSIQSMISVGSGRIFGRGLGEGIQTQLKYLPEKQTDFIFAAISEEMGLLGSFLILLSFFVIFYILIKIIEVSSNQTVRVFVSGVFFIFLAQTFIHIGMNMGIVPVTGLPLPFVSSGGSALIGSSIMLSIAAGSNRCN